MNRRTKWLSHRRTLTHQRTGITLLEVLLSLAILGVSLAAIGTLVNSAYRNARRAELRSEANLLCNTKMSEFAAGILGSQNSAVSTTSVPESPGWQFEVNVESSDIPGLLRATVVVGRADVTQDQVIVSASRLVPDPDFDPATENAQ